MLAAAIKALKACQEKLKCQTMGIDFSDEGGKINLPISKDWIVAEIKDLKAVYSLM
jgi:hypothetical protein